MLGTLDIKVRPLKFALLVEPGNSIQLLDAMRTACSFWGGSNFPIIPMHRRKPRRWKNEHERGPSAKEMILGLIDAYDPDKLIQFCNWTPEYLRGTGRELLDARELWKISEYSHPYRPKYGIGVYQLLNDIFEEEFKYRKKYPTKVSIPAIPEKLKLFWTSIFGDYQNHIRSEVEKHYSDPLEIERITISENNFSSLISGDILYPRRISSWKLQDSGIGAGRGYCLYFLDATNLDDITDYWNLRASGRAVFPMPRQFVEDGTFRAEAIRFIEEVAKHGVQDFSVAHLICSRSCKFDELSTFASGLELTPSPDSDAKRSKYMLQRTYPRLWDEWARNKDGGVGDFYSTEKDSVRITELSASDIQINPLIPKFAGDNVFGNDAQCANELDFHFYGADDFFAEVYPRSHGLHLTHAISSIASSSDEWRIGKYGIVKLVNQDWPESRAIPTSESVLFAWLKDMGWEAELSTPGILAKQIYKRLNGHPRVLASKSTLGLIEYMNGGSVDRNGAPLNGKLLQEEREVSAGELRSRLGENWGPSNKLDHFIEHGVFRLGLRTKCPNCQRGSWFPLSSLREKLECPKCLNDFPAAGHIDKKSAEWHYRTAGAFSVPNFADGAYSVLLTLELLCERFSYGLKTTAVPSFTAKAPDRTPLEADLAMFWREVSGAEVTEGLLFGECKTYGKFLPRDFDRMQYICENFPGAIVVFSTFRDSLTDPEIRSAKRLAKAGRKHWKPGHPVNPILVLTGNELFSARRPPECWAEPHRSRFSAAHGLLSLCDATQQIYLGMKSWHQEWLAKWERRSKQSKK